VLLPRENDADIPDIPEAVRNEMEFVLLDNVNDALKQVLVR
jgi:ATP-dependent Lon protease